MQDDAGYNVATFAVLTGDIVASTGLSPARLDAAMETLATATREISGWRPGLVAGFGRRGGDAWQCAVSAPGLALRAALYFTAVLRREGADLSTRIAIATGQGALPGDADTNRGHGPAFVASGRLLAEIDSHARMAHADGGALGAATRLADHVAQGWTPAQARAMSEMMPPGAGPRAAAARRLGITRQAVDQALWAAGFPALDAALEMIEAMEEAAS
jgi:hypothetical protein